MSLDPEMRDLIDGFVIEAQGIADNVTRTLLELERQAGPGPALVEGWKSIARGLHTLKGSSATIGLHELAKAIHALESDLTERGAMGAPPTAAIVDVILQALDQFLSLLRAAASADSPLSGASAGGGETSSQTASTDELTGSDDLSWRIDARHISRLTVELERLRELRQRVNERRRRIDLCVSSLAKLSNAAETAAVRAALAGVSRAIADDAEEVVSLASSLDDDLRSMSTQPVRAVLEPLQRGVRDLCQKVGKRARLSTVGAELSLDRRLLEAIRGPLGHLVRNAVDHGVETPEVRVARGKHAEASINIRVEQEGNLVRFEISDDGGGLDLAVIRERAVTLGLKTKQQVDALDDEQTARLIFLPGFSTRTMVTQTSGRGVGLDVVRTEIERLSGDVEVESTTAKGTRFRLAVPTEFGSSPLMLVRCGEQRFAIPIGSIEEAMSAGRCDIHTTRESVKVLHGGQLLQVHELSHMLRLRPASAIAPEQAVLFLHASGARAGVVVDAIEGDVDLMIRALPLELRSIGAYQGVATLAGGELVLVLRARYLVQPSVSGRAGEKLRRALVIDDSLTARAMHRSILEAGGYVVNTVSGVVVGLEQLRKGSYDVVICDVAMEGMSGLEFATLLRADSKFAAQPLILVSAHDEPGDRDAGLRAGADAYLGKQECATGALLAAADAAVAARRRRG